MEKEIIDLIKQPLQDGGIDIADVFYGIEDHTNILRITIDKEPYVDVDDCVKVTKIVNPLLDASDIIPQTYILDVCSKEKGGEK